MRWFSVVVTVIWIVGMMNVINLLDGMDGLAAGISAIAGATFAVLAPRAGPAGGRRALGDRRRHVPRLRHNFYPARIFMGDSLARIFSASSLPPSRSRAPLKTAATMALFFPLIVLAVPILDTSFVIAKRLKYGRPDGADPLAPVPPLPQHRLHPTPCGGLLLHLGARSRAARSRRASCRSAAGASGTCGRPCSWRRSHCSVLATSLYMVYVLEILKLRRLRAWAGRRQADEPVRAAAEERDASGLTYGVAAATGASSPRSLSASSHTALASSRVPLSGSRSSTQAGAVIGISPTIGAMPWRLVSPRSSRPVR